MSIFTKLSNWWNRDTIRLEERMNEFAKQAEERQLALDAQLETERTAREAAEKEASEVREAMEVYRQRDEADAARRNSTEPWVEIKSADYSAIKGIHIELDWNDAFVQYLKDSGVKGRDEETIVQKWLAFLYADLITRLEQQSIDKSDQHRVNDFE